MTFTEEQFDAAIAALRTEIEKMVSSVNRRFYLNDGSTFPDEGLVEMPGVTWTDEAQVLAVIPEGSRTEFLTVNIEGVEYWFRSGVLVIKGLDMSIPDHSITLIKLVDIASQTFLGRNTAGTGQPEVLDMPTALEMLGLTNILSLLDGKVDKVFEKSLVQDALIQLIHAPHSDDQDLSLYVLKDGDKVLSDNNYTDEEKAKLASLHQDIYTITLPQYGTVAERCSNAVVTVDYPTGWVLDEDINPNDISITHTLGRRIVDVKVLYVDNGEETILTGNLAYSGFTAKTNNRLVIRNLATIGYPIVIHLIFA
jgi:hypothetical protein